MHAESVFIGLGSNLGDRTAHLRAGLEGLQAAGLSIGEVSSLYLTEPELDTPSAAHPWYVNCVAAVSGATDPASLLRACLDVEEGGGRRRHGGGDPGENPRQPEPRTLDLDVLLFGTTVVDEPDLRIPHPRMHRRRFVLQPLHEIAPAALHPTKGATAADMLENLPAAEGVWLLAPFPVATF